MSSQAGGLQVEAFELLVGPSRVMTGAWALLIARPIDAARAPRDDAQPALCASTDARQSLLCRGRRH